MRRGEENGRPIPQVRRAKRREVEFINSGNDVPQSELIYDEPQKGDGKRGPKPGLKQVRKLSDRQIDDACDRVILGESILKIAEELKVNKDALARAIKVRCGMMYLRKWQQSVSYDCLRAELLLKRAMAHPEDPRWTRIALDVLAYRAKVLGFERVNPETDATIRVAGMTQSEIFAAFAKRL